MRLKEAMRKAKETGKPQRVNEATPITDVKVNISIRLDLDILNALKSEAAENGLPYQTLINFILRKHLKEPKLEERILQVERKLNISR